MSLLVSVRARVCVFRSSLRGTDFMVREKFKRTHQSRMIPALAAVRCAGVEQLLRRGGVGKRHSNLACRGECQIQILLMKLDPKSGIKRTLDHPLAVNF